MDKNNCFNVIAQAIDEALGVIEGVWVFSIGLELVMNSSMYSSTDLV
jgi:hypothetical protein